LIETQNLLRDTESIPSQQLDRDKELAALLVGTLINGIPNHTKEICSVVKLKKSSSRSGPEA
jgi:hypothetical protein